MEVTRPARRRRKIMLRRIAGKLLKQKRQIGWEQRRVRTLGEMSLFLFQIYFRIGIALCFFRVLIGALIILTWASYFVVIIFGIRLVSRMSLAAPTTPASRRCFRGDASLLAGFRGGASDNAEDMRSELHADNPLPAAHAGGDLRVMSHEEFLYRADAVSLSGRVDGNNEYTAARTSGDGACALHSAFGVPTAENGRIHCNRVRSLVVEKLPRTFNELTSAQHAYLRDAAEAILNTIWSESILPAAKSIVVDTDAQLPREAKCQWEQLPPDIQEVAKGAGFGWRGWRC